MDLYCTFDKPERIAATRGARGTGTQAPWWLTAIVGAVLVGAGVYIARLDAFPEWLPSSGTVLPDWAFLAAGAALLVPGLSALASGMTQFERARRREQIRLENPGRPQLADHPWSPDGVAPSPWEGLFSQFISMLLLTVALAAVAAFSHWRHDDGFGKAVFAIFALVALGGWFTVLARSGRALKFGRARLQFRRFPYRVGEPIELLWWPPTGLRQVDRGTLVLRCITEWLEGSGKHVRLVHEACWQESWSYEKPRELPPGVPVTLKFEPPAGLPGTQLDAKKPVFWELEIDLAVPGLDYREAYLIPVY